MFSTSVNIVRDSNKELNYIVTANAKQVVGKIINSFTSGIHSFCLVGSYGTGKSSFILALENTLMGRCPSGEALFRHHGQFNNATDFEFVNIVGEYDSLANTIKPHLTLPDSRSHNFFELLKRYYEHVKRQGKFLVLVIDEFGKMLEYAASNNPEREMYFLQNFVEFVNDTGRDMMLLTTLHQGFGAYAKGLKPEQRQEWTKVKGRITDIVFKEPVEQTIALTAARIAGQKRTREPSSQFNRIFPLATASRFISPHLNEKVALALYPLDIIAASVITQANQRYGQNERTLFTFLDSKGEGTLRSFEPREDLCYNLSHVYDYIIYNYYDYLSCVNEDSAQWSAIRTAIERTEGLQADRATIERCVAIIKVVGLLNIFASATATVDERFLDTYARNAMGIPEGIDMVRRLEREKILRYAIYKKKYILFDGTDVDIESGMLAASAACNRQHDYTDQLQAAFHFKAVIANAHYYRTGTPRYFEYCISCDPKSKVPAGDTDGYINLVFPHSNNLEDARHQCEQTRDVAIVFCIFNNTSTLEEHLFEIEKLRWVKEKYIADDNDKVAHREVDNLIAHEGNLLHEALFSRMFSPDTEWYFNGEKVGTIHCERDLTRFISLVADTIYSKTPVFKNELINKHKPSSTISNARQILLLNLLTNSEKEDLGFERNKFPPEKAIYKTLLQSTGIHRANGALYTLGQPFDDSSFLPLWEACEEFLASTHLRPKKLGELTKLLQEAPFRLKQGMTAVWLPIFLIAKRDDFSLYSGDRYVPYINKEVLELIQKNPNDFSVKAFTVDGVKRQFFDKYREAINLKRSDLKADTFIETIRPFLTFYNKLNRYAQTTNDISHVARKFRDAIKDATDPEKTFFETLPETLGFKEVALSQKPEAIDSFVEVLHSAIRELRSCYDDYIKQVELNILKTLAIKEENYTDYKPRIEKRYRNVKTELMTSDIRNFHARLTGKFADMRTWIESICYVVLNKPLESIKDSEKSYLMASLGDRLFQLDDYVEMHQEDSASVIRFHITQNKSAMKSQQVVIPEGKEKEVECLENKIESLLSEDESLNIAALVQLLNKKMK